MSQCVACFGNDILRRGRLTCASFTGQMTKPPRSVFFLSALILLPLAAWCGAGGPLDLQVGRGLLQEGGASGSTVPGPQPVLFKWADTSFCLNWGPDAKAVDPRVVDCGNAVTDVWEATNYPSVISSGFKCISVCVDGNEGSGCTLLKPPSIDVNLTECKSGPIPDYQLWQATAATDRFVQLVSLQTKTCLTTDGRAVFTAPCIGSKEQLWLQLPFPPDK